MARHKKKTARKEDHEESTERAMELTRPEPGRKGPNKIGRGKRRGEKARKAIRGGGRR